MEKIYILHRRRYDDHDNSSRILAASRSYAAMRRKMVEDIRAVIPDPDSDRWNTRLTGPLRADDLTQRFVCYTRVRGTDGGDSYMWRIEELELTPE